jgi:hypothetical protein
LLGLDSGRSQDHCGASREIRYRVDHCTRGVRLVIDLLDPRVDDFDCRRDEPGRIENLGGRHAWPLQWPRQDERELDLDPWRYEIVEGQVAAGVIHAAEQRREIRLTDLAGELHRA